MICLRKNKHRGALLLELLISISILVVILTVSAQAVYVSLQSSKASGGRDTAISLASEGVEALRAVADGQWLNIYNLTKGTQHYYPVLSSNTWSLAPGDETIELNNAVFTRYITIDNTSRDQTTRAIEASYNASNDDPSTQKGTVVVSWVGGDTVTLSQYFFRWRNSACAQASWVAGGSGNTVKPCGTTDYNTVDVELDLTAGTVKLQ